MWEHLRSIPLYFASGGLNSIKHAAKGRMTTELGLHVVRNKTGQEMAKEKELRTVCLKTLPAKDPNEYLA